MKRAVRKGLVAPGLAAIATGITYLVEGPGPALAVLAVATAALVAFHLRHLQLVIDWASGPLDAKVPHGRGEWIDAFTAIHRRVRLRAAYQRDLQELIERFHRAADAMPDGIALLDQDFRIEWVNPAATGMLGLAMPGDRKRPIVNLFRPPEFLRYLEAGHFEDPVVIESFRDARTLSVQVVRLNERENLLIARDVSQAEALARMRREFIANVSHELKTPLTVIAGFVETLQDVDFEPAQREQYLGLMADQTRSMQRLVDDLLALSALESERNLSQDDEFEVAALLRELLADAKALSDGRHDVTLDDGDGWTILGDRRELASAFGNLVSNAVRYTPDGGAVRLGWRVAADGTGVFAVTDTGIGIAPEHIPRLTERFYRVDRSRSRNTGGTGLGLAIVKHVLIRHQAELDIRSTPGAGSTFAARLPAWRVRAKPPSTAGEERAPPPGGPGGGDASSSAPA